jgi:two-component system, chemotaxis family, CheB/CheR fusion protein
MKKKLKDYSEDLYIIAIGASAGGMEAIHMLFDHTFEDDVAYIVVQHLSPDHKSFMAELLAKHSRLKISVAENEMLVEANQIYLMPQGKNMTIKNRRLMLTDIKETHRNTSIDIFFDSLAVSLEDKSIAIILSGTGTDGTKGIATIKKYGGFVIAQDPESAKFDGMPNSAIKSGNVDVILAPELIPAEILSHLRRKLLEGTFDTPGNEHNEAALVKILHLINEHTPLDFSDYKRPTLIRRIVSRMTKNNLTLLEEYADYLKTNPAEITILSKQFMIGVTQFFRDNDAFEVLKKKIIPEIVESKLQVDTVKVWVVGCTTGEEAYSIAILIMEYLTEVRKNLEVKIFASDIDKEALLFASKGLYLKNIEKAVSPERLNKFFTKKGQQYEVKTNIRKMIIFAEHDIVKQPPYGKIDLISCRNMLIYMNPILQNKVLASLYYCLNSECFLFLGPSESLGELKESFTEEDKKWRIFKRTDKVPHLRDNTYTTMGLNRRFLSQKLGELPQKNDLKSKLTAPILQMMLEVSGYDAGVLVDTNFEIKESFGACDKYLLPKILNYNLLEMLPEALSIVTSTTVHRALKSRKKYTENVKFKKNEIVYSTNILMKPFLSEQSSTESLVLVMFTEEKTENKSTESSTEVFAMEAHTMHYIEAMREELAETKLRLEDAQKELEISNEYVSAYNEELISSNEEMQSTNEELQSLNEELQTVNTEYQLKIRELAELNDDLNNYFKSTISAQLYVDSDLVLQKFTPSAIKQINLKESDIGRLISDISTKIRFSTLMDDIVRVNSTGATVDKEVQTIDGRWYHMTALPYLKYPNNQIDGVNIAFHDITELKKVQDKLSRINADHDTFIYAVSHDLRGPLNNLVSVISHLKTQFPTPQSDQNNDLIDLIDLIDSSTRNLKEVINELTDIAKIESEIEEQDYINIEEILNEIQESIKLELRAAKAKIYLELKKTEIPFSKKNLRSILFNLLSNAIKYRSPDRNLEVTISTQESGEFIVLSVADNGLGIAEKEKERIFGAFQRAHQKSEGLGVGLYLVKKTVTNAGGDIELESELGKGSIFKIYFRMTLVN